jgi:D-sedoheptulose 7-phosphate isomerase
VKESYKLIELIRRYPQLEPLEVAIADSVNLLIKCFSEGGKLLICGNGGSCADADHIVGELMKGFENPRTTDESFRSKLQSLDPERADFLASGLQKALPAISLTVHQSLITAVANDLGADLIFAQQVMGYGQKGDILLAISTSGNSRNVTDAILTAKAKELKVIGITGQSGGRMKNLCDILINVPESRTAFVQELQLPVFHAFCMLVEDHFFNP